MKEAVHADKVQLDYAAVLGVTSTVGMVLIAAGYIAYLCGLLPSAVSAEEVARNWHLKASEFHKVVHFPSGWEWTGFLGLGDILSYASINYLALVTVICLAWIIPSFVREKDRIYTVMTILQVFVLVFAAAGVVGGGH
ncbi:MAG: DUF1634 domain-containing protein [Chlorobiaceae bacterium]|nr:DUF1634 domain-containing protein [Chlorobiaceae bacterium]NTV59898.1 DUF1634 domain-containing protein [Chlorobiaceae bacterium]